MLKFSCFPAGDNPINFINIPGASSAAGKEGVLKQTMYGCMWWGTAAGGGGGQGVKPGGRQQPDGEVRESGRLRR